MLSAQGLITFIGEVHSNDSRLAQADQITILMSGSPSVLRMRLQQALQFQQARQEDAFRLTSSRVPEAELVHEQRSQHQSIGKHQQRSGSGQHSSSHDRDRRSDPMDRDEISSSMGSSLTETPDASAIDMPALLIGSRVPSGEFIPSETPTPSASTPSMDSSPVDSSMSDAMDATGSEADAGASGDRSMDSPTFRQPLSVPLSASESAVGDRTSLGLLNQAGISFLETSAESTSGSPVRYGLGTADSLLDSWLQRTARQAEALNEFESALDAIADDRSRIEFQAADLLDRYHRANAAREAIQMGKVNSAQGMLLLASGQQTGGDVWSDDELDSAARLDQADQWSYGIGLFRTFEGSVIDQAQSVAAQDRIPEAMPPVGNAERSEEETQVDLSGATGRSTQAVGVVATLVGMQYLRSRREDRKRQPPQSPDSSFES